MTTNLDVTRVDGPHTPEKTYAAARRIAEAVRYLNYATLPADGAPGIAGPADVDYVLGHVAHAVGGLQQTIDQLQSCLRRDLETGRLAMDSLPGRPFQDNPPAAVGTALDELEQARAALESLHARLRGAQRYTGGMRLELEDDEDALPGEVVRLHDADDLREAPRIEQERPDDGIGLGSSRGAFIQSTAR